MNAIKKFNFIHSDIQQISFKVKIPKHNKIHSRMFVKFIINEHMFLLTNINLFTYSKPKLLSKNSFGILKMI